MKTPEERYPPDGYGPGWDDKPVKCTCKADCPVPCKGGCGCEPCSVGYADFLSCPDE